jgi:hypothetical protein
MTSLCVEPKLLHAGCPVLMGCPRMTFYIDDQQIATELPA